MSSRIREARQNNPPHRLKFDEAIEQLDHGGPLQLGDAV
jgi:hypothetical protein